jgi:pilus assembly protein CpaE
LSLNRNQEPIVLLFTATPELARLEAALTAVGLTTLRVSSMETARQVLAENRGACSAVLDTSPATAYSVDSVYRLLHQSPPVPTLLLFGQGANPWLDAENVSPIDDYAYLRDPVEELVRRVQVLSRRVALASPTAPALAGPRRFQQGQSIVVYGPKGGVGRTTVAVNLAVMLARLYQKQVALIDADLWFGDVSVLLDVRSGQSISSLLDGMQSLESDSLKSVLVPHSSGVHVLRAPTALMSVEAIPEHVPARLVTMCRSMFDYVIVDTQTGLQEYVLQLLEGASQIALVTTPELSTIRSTARVLEVAPGLGWAEKLLLVLNRANSGLPPSAVEEALGRRIDVSLVNDERRVVEAGNAGEPLLFIDPKGGQQITRDFGRLAAQIADEPEPKWGSGMRLWGRARGLLGRGTPPPAPSEAAAAQNEAPSVQSAAPAVRSGPEHGSGPTEPQRTNGQHAESARSLMQHEGQLEALGSLSVHTLEPEPSREASAASRNGAHQGH